jgi:hypothetical protein
VKSLLLTLAVLVIVSVSMTVAAFLYGGATVGVPYPEPTPAQAASQRYHFEVFDCLMLGTGMSWLITFGAAGATTMIRVVNRKRNQMEDER